MNVLMVALKCDNKEETLNNLRGLIEVLENRDFRIGSSEIGCVTTGFGPVEYDYKVVKKILVTLD